MLYEKMVEIGIKMLKKKACFTFAARASGASSVLLTAPTLFMNFSAVKYLLAELTRLAEGRAEKRKKEEGG